MGWLADLIRSLSGAGRPASGPMPSPLPPGELSTDEAALLDGINRARAVRRLPPLEAHATLHRVARDQSVTMAAAGRMSHDAGAPFGVRIKASGWRWPAAENVAADCFTGREAVREWELSPGHLANIVYPDWRFVGTGCCVSDGNVPYWCAVFG